MALLYPWATKEYLLWNMTIGQIVLYHNHAMDIRNGKKPKGGLENKSAAERRELRDSILGEVNNITMDAMKEKYGDI